MSTTGAYTGDKDALKNRAEVPKSLDHLVVGEDDEYKKHKEDELKEFFKSLLTLESVVAPILFTALSFFVRLYRISANDAVVWDEAHFGKFGSYYLRHEFYHDVHPPLGKMLIGLSGYLAGYNGSWDFPSGEAFPDYVDYTKMRVFQAVFSALCVPLAYYTVKEIGFSIAATWLFTLMVALESSYVTLGKFILLDSMLLFFTVSTFFCFARFENHNTSSLEFGRKWWKWLLLTGLLIGCVCSVKMVGLFITTVIGIHTIVDLWTKFGDKKVSWARYAGHWTSRIFGLIIVPTIVFLISFKVHFDLLYKSGTGDANMSSLFQANLLGSDVNGGAREISIAQSSFTLKNQGLSGGLLHSHVQTYPEGSKQQQITTYSHKDANNNWIFQRPRGEPFYDTDNNNTAIEYVLDGMSVRIMHPLTGRNLHSHDVQAPISNSQYEVACYGNMTVGDEKDNWVVEIMEQQSSNEDKLRLHPLTSSFRLKNTVMNCYLAVTGNSLPAWGFRQGEVVCYKNPFKKDKRAWWNIENNSNDLLPPAPADFELPRTRFLRDFIQLNLAMMATNNALVPEYDKQDDLASSFWQWPTLNVGIRMCTWADDKVKYFMIGSPATTWTSSVAVLFFFGIVLYYLIRWQRQYVDFPAENPRKLKLFVMGGIYPMFGWGLHFVPFVIMGRVTYVHHYVPALYFAMIVFVYEVESFTNLIVGPHGIKSPHTSLLRKLSYFSIYAFWYVVVAGTFWYLRYISFGMEGPKEDWKHLDLLSSWRISDDNYK